MMMCNSHDWKKGCNGTIKQDPSFPLRIVEKPGTENDPELTWVFVKVGNSLYHPEMDLCKFFGAKKKNQYRRGEHGARIKAKIKHNFCLVCKKTENLTVDHIVPRCLGGSVINKDNLMLLCKCCNNAKSNLMPRDWFNDVVKNNKLFQMKGSLLPDTIETAMKLFNKFHDPIIARAKQPCQSFIENMFCSG